MRAKIPCNTRATPEQIQQAMTMLGWWPEYDGGQQNLHVLEKKEEILSRVHEEDREAARAGHMFTIFNEHYGCWGIISRGSSGSLTFRLQHHDRQNLQDSTSNLVSNLVDYGKKNDQAPKFHFPVTVVVYERNGNSKLMEGDVVTGRWFRYVVRKQAAEVFVGSLLLAIAFFLAVLTFPGVNSYFSAAYDPHATLQPVQQWLIETTPRIWNALAVTALVTIVGVLFRYFDLKKSKPVIAWR